MDELEAQALRDKLLTHVKTTVEDLHQVLLWQTNTLFTSAPLPGPEIGTPGYRCAIYATGYLFCL